MRDISKKGFEMKTASDFEKAAGDLKITWFENHRCSICDTPVGWRIRGSKVFYDSGCDCSSGGENFHDSSWQEIADFYNRNAGAKDALERMAQYPEFKRHVDETNKLWGFVSQEVSG